MISLHLSLTHAKDFQFHCDTQNCEKGCTHYCGVFVCRGTLQLLCGGGDMVEAILMQCPPLPDSAPILLFPFHCDSCWDRLLGDHIPGTKRAQLVWTGLSDTTSCSGCESLLSMQAFGLKITCHVFFLPVSSIMLPIHTQLWNIYIYLYFLESVCDRD